VPIYDFRCRGCGATSELLLPDGDTDKARCPECGSDRVEKLLSAFNTAKSRSGTPGQTCCGRQERCDKPPCEGGGSCSR
jgi:putative FmdB family regulatory protein